MFVEQFSHWKLILHQHCIDGYIQPISNHLRCCTRLNELASPALARLAADHFSTGYTHQYNLAGALGNMNDTEEVEIDWLVKPSSILKHVNEEILKLARSIEHATIDKIMAMAEIGLAEAVLSGKIKPPI